MRFIVRGVSLAGALCVLAGVAQAADGVLLVTKTTIDSGAPATNQVHIESKRMRAESSGARGEKMIVVFDGAKQVMTLIDNEKKTYTEMTKADVDAIGGQMASMTAQMEDQLKNLPPEQRAKIEAMMKGRGAGTAMAAAPKVQYKKVGTGTVGKWTCDRYEGYASGQKTSDICTVDPKTLGFSAADFEISRELAAFFKKLMPANAAQVFSLGVAEDQGFSGIPVRSVSTTGGRQITTEVTEVSRQTFADAIFQVPAGYQKQVMGMGRGRGRQ
jgi:carbon monoxide dehydrogenase subunit G